MPNPKYYYKRLRCFNCGHEQEYQIPWGTKWDHYMNGGGVECWADGPTCPKCGCRDYYEPLHVQHGPTMATKLPSKGEIDSIIWAHNTVDNLFHTPIADDPFGFKTLM